jgi:hypothetical protein
VKIFHFHWILHAAKWPGKSLTSSHGFCPDFALCKIVGGQQCLIPVSRLNEYTLVSFPFSSLSQCFLSYCVGQGSTFFERSARKFSQSCVHSQEPLQLFNPIVRLMITVCASVQLSIDYPSADNYYQWITLQLIITIRGLPFG